MTIILPIIEFLTAIHTIRTHYLMVVEIYIGILQLLVYEPDYRWLKPLKSFGIVCF